MKKIHHTQFQLVREERIKFAESNTSQEQSRLVPKLQSIGNETFLHSEQMHT